MGKLFALLCLNLVWVLPHQIALLDETSREKRDRVIQKLGERYILKAFTSEEGRNYYGIVYLRGTKNDLPPSPNRGIPRTFLELF